MYVKERPRFFPIKACAIDGPHPSAERAEQPRVTFNYGMQICVLYLFIWSLAFIYLINYF